MIKRGFLIAYIFVFSIPLSYGLMLFADYPQGLLQGGVDVKIFHKFIHVYISGLAEHVPSEKFAKYLTERIHANGMIYLDLGMEESSMDFMEKYMSEKYK